MALQSKNNLSGGINLDLDETRMPANTALFIKNLTNNVNMNASAAALAGQDAFVYTPLEGNVALSVSGMPSGTNYGIGFYSSEQTNEGYYALLNSNSNHSVWVISGDTGVVRKVYQGALLPFVDDPQYFLCEGRMVVELRSIIDPVTKLETNFKFLVFTNNTEYQCFLDVEASIATNSYSTPYFTTSGAFYSTLELISLAPPLPIKCVKLNDPNPYVPFTSDSSIENSIVAVGGSGYNPLDLFSINGGSTLAQGQITKVDGSGAVTAYIIVTAGEGYVVTGTPSTTFGGAGTGLTISILSISLPDSSKQNLLINNGWQFRVRTWDVWGRPSEWGIISSVFTVLIGGGCINTSNGLKRCVNLCFDAGNPTVKFITVAYRRGVGNDPSGQTQTNWYEHETFRKYDDSTGVQWYDRPINPNFSAAFSGMTFDAASNIITYTFCADKESNPIDPTEAARTEPQLPRWSSGVAPVNKKLLLANNVYGFEPIAQNVTDSIQFSVVPPTDGGCPAAPLRTVVMYSAIYIPVALLATEHRGFINKIHGKVGFGRSSGDCGQYGNYSMDQIFGDQDNPGFIGLFRGTNIKVVCDQGTLDSSGNFTKVPDWPTGIYAAQNMVQRYTFNGVPAGKYIAQVASHKSKVDDGDLQRTSTYVGGIGAIQDLDTPTGMNSYASNPLKEIEIDCSTADIHFNQPTDPFFIIFDMVIGNGSAAIDGYLYEQNDKSNPIEMNPMFFRGVTMGASGANAFGSFFTDHNGFFFAATDGYKLEMYAYGDWCDGPSIQRRIYGPTNTSSPYLLQAEGGIKHGDGNGSSSTCTGVHGNWRNRVYFFPTSGTYPDAARRIIKQKIMDCNDPGIGVPGIPLVMTKVGPYAFTDNSGQGMLVAHNRYNYIDAIAPHTASEVTFSNLVPLYGNPPLNRDKLIFSQKGGCQWNACGGCATYMPDVSLLYLGCGVVDGNCPLPQVDRVLCLPDKQATANGIGLFGVQSGGKYPVAYWLHDTIARHTAPQIRGGNLAYVYVPNLTDTQDMALFSLAVTIPAGLTVDPVFKKMTFLVGANCLFRDYFSWGADWIQYVDNTGQTNEANPTSIRVYFQSLNEYNKQYNFGTNIGWDFIAGQNDTNGVRDVVQFIVNGDGTWLPPQKGAPITFDKAGSFFTIDYNSDLAGLQNGCLFRVIRPIQNITGTNLPYYEQCLTLDVNDGVLPAGTWVIPYQDSYLLSRAIPVPKMKGQPGLIPPGGEPPNDVQYTSTNLNSTIATDGYSTNNTSNSNEILVFDTEDFTAVYPFFFESPSPSDLWGSHLASRGRVGIPNPYEQQFRLGTEIALSNPLADKGIVNGIGAYPSQNRKTFDRNAYGDIAVVLVEMGVCMAICRNDYFITRYNQTNLQVDDNGNVTGQLNGGSIFSDPQAKVGSNYGVVPQNINTIQQFQGVVIFVDNNGHLIFSNFDDAKPMEKDGYQGYLRNKIAVVNIANNSSNFNGKTYFHGGIDPSNMEYVLTMFNIPTSGSPSYINTRTQPAPGLVNETLRFDMSSGSLRSFPSYTGEFYGRIPGYYLQSGQLISFKQGTPFIHHNTLLNNVPPPPYCNYYGVQCEVRITHIINGVDGKLLPDKVKRFFYNEIYCRQSIKGPAGSMPSALFYADAILSEKGQQSRLTVARWDLRDGYQTSAFLCATNTPPDPNNVPQTTSHAILDGDPLQGRWLSVSFTNNPQWNGVYFEVSAIATYTNAVEKSAD